MTANKASTKEKIINWNMSNFKFCILRDIFKWKADFPVGPVVKSFPSNAEGVDSIPGQGAHPTRLTDKNWSKTKAYVENAPHQKNLRKKGGEKTMYTRQINIYNTHTYTKLLQLWLENGWAIWIKISAMKILKWSISIRKDAWHW